MSPEYQEVRDWLQMRPDKTAYFYEEPIVFAPGHGRPSMTIQAIRARGCLIEYMGKSRGLWKPLHPGKYQEYRWHLPMFTRVYRVWLAKYILKTTKPKYTAYLVAQSKMNEPGFALEEERNVA